MPIIKAVFSAASDDIRSLSLKTVGVKNDGGIGGTGGGRYSVVDVVGVVESTAVDVVEEDSAVNEGELGPYELPPELLDTGIIGESDVAPLSVDVLLVPEVSGIEPEGNTVWLVAPSVDPSVK